MAVSGMKMSELKQRLQQLERRMGRRQSSQLTMEEKAGQDMTEKEDSNEVRSVLEEDEEEEGGEEADESMEEEEATEQGEIGAELQPSVAQPHTGDMDVNTDVRSATHNATLNSTVDLEEVDGVEQEGHSLEENDSSDNEGESGAKRSDQKDEAERDHQTKEHLLLCLSVTKAATAILQPRRKAWYCPEGSYFHQPAEAESNHPLAIDQGNYSAQAAVLLPHLRALQEQVEQQEKELQLLPTWLLQKAVRDKQLQFIDDSDQR